MSAAQRNHTVENITSFQRNNGADIAKKSPNSSKVFGDYMNRVAYGPLLDTVFKLRYESYSAQDFIEKNDSKLFMDEYDDKPNCTSHLTFFKGSAIASIRSCVYDPAQKLDMPVMEVFRDEIGETIGYDKLMVEINKFVIAPSFQRRGGVAARFMVYDNVVSAAEQLGADCLVTAVREEHIEYYNALFGSRQISDLKSYPKLNFKTALLATDDIAKFRRRLDRRLNPRKKQDDSSSRHRIC